VSHARNVGLDHARGEYITFIDADDRIHGNLLEQLYGHAKKSGASMVIGNLQKVWDGQENTVILQMPYHGLYSLDELLPDFARIQQETGIYGFCVAKLLRRNLIADTRFDCTIRLAEDLNFYLDIYPRVDTIYFDPNPHYDYLQAAENSSMLVADNRIDYLAQLTIQQKLLSFLQNNAKLYGENRRIMIARIYDYVFFTLFHCRLRDFCQLSARIRALDLPAREPAAQETPVRRVLLFLHARSLDRMAMLFLGTYRSASYAARLIRRRRE
jgi:glycosyltransferase involved in cell wall biosynthesis